MNLIQKFHSVFGTAPVIEAKSPGRVNLIGEHTDYNDGFVMPIAIQYAANILASPREDHDIHIHSVDFRGSTSFTIINPIDFDKIDTWSNYQRGVIDQFLKRGSVLKGANLLVSGNVPIGAGLSSSAAVEMASAIAVKTLNHLNISMIELIKLSQAAENQFVGMNCGIMDQFISGMGRKGMALFLDCRHLEYEHVPFPDDLYTVMIMNTKVKRELTGTQYNERRRQCEEGVRLLQKKMPNIRALRDVSVLDFETHQEYLPKIVRKRCRHVIHENARVIAFVDALKSNDVDRIGKLLRESHESLKDLYEVSCRELDIMVSLAEGVEGVTGARMTGAGFGGCAIALVKKGNERRVEETIMTKYPDITGIKPEIYISEACEGASVREL